LGRRAVILMNLGGPDDLSAVQPFLFNLFNDPAIIGVPRVFRWLLAQLLSRRRTPIAQSIYSKVGGASPLLKETQKQAQELEARLGVGNRVFIAMRYWHPRSYETAQAVREYNPESIVLLPLYPQYSSTTTGSSVNDWNRAVSKIGLHKPTTLVGCYPTNSLFIAAHAKLLRAMLETTAADSGTRVLFSAHGLPEKIIARGDPYQWQVEQTAGSIVEELAMPSMDWEVCYQSRVGPLRWIGPSTEDLIARAGAEKKPVIIVPIAFVSEHSETLVELDIEYAELARRAGVPSYKRVATLGVSDNFLEALREMVESAGSYNVQSAAGKAGHCPPNFSLCCKGSEATPMSNLNVLSG
jgi:ferrochelatase